MVYSPSKPKWHEFLAKKLLWILTDFAENWKTLINHFVLTGYEIWDLRVKVKGYLSPEITTFLGNIFKMLCHYKSYDYCCLCWLMSSNTVTLVEYFEKITRNWIASRNASWTLLTKMQSPRENDAWLSCRGNRIVISF